MKQGIASLIASSALTLGASFSAAPAFAVQLSADGIGQALVYPYYTVRSLASGNAYVSAINVGGIL